jgi:hypothetical protein
VLRGQVWQVAQRQHLSLRHATADVVLQHTHTAPGRGQCRWRCAAADSVVNRLLGNSNTVRRYGGTEMRGQYFSKRRLGTGIAAT